MDHIQKLRYCLFTALVGLSLLTTLSSAVAHDGGIEPDSVEKVITIKLTTENGANHINWTVKGQNDLDLFVVQRAVNWEGYKTLEFVSGFSVSASVAVPHTFIDKNPPEGNVRYKIQNFRDDKIVMSSDIVKANKPK